MKENIKVFFQNENVRKFGRRIFNKKTFIAAVIIIVIAIAARLTFSVLFEVEGTVSKVDGSKITVVNFLGNKTVDIGGFQSTSNSIQVGDRIEIKKNLSGDIMSVRDGSKRNLRENGREYGTSTGEVGNNFKGRGGRNSMRRK